QRATERGYRLGLPNGSAAEQAAVGAIWRGDTAAIARLSARYSPPMQLIGKLYRGGAGWKADWTLVDHGRVPPRQSEGDVDALRLAAALQRMSVVRAIRPVRATADRLELDLDLLTGLPGFRRMADEAVLLEVEGGDELTPVYLLR